MNKVTLADVVQLPPSSFSLPSARAIEDWINAKYADKVLHKIGLCVGFHSLISCSEGLIGHGNGIVNVNVDFRMIVFRPFRGEILQGTIAQSDVKDGIWLSMDFFEDLQVPPSVLFDPSVYQQEGEDGVFVWRSENPEAENGYDEYFFDRNEKCLCRVEMEQWNDLSPQLAQQQQKFSAGGAAGEEEEAVEEPRKQPYAVQASMMHSGLGPKLWWLGEDELAQEAQDEPADEMEVDGGAEQEAS